jgi:5-formyltetrahydrofolate cyclo-ligase
MVDPSPPTDTAGSLADLKAQLRRHYRAVRREHVAALPQSMRALLFLRPPAPVLDLIPEGARVGLYHPHPSEAPTLSYARWLHENGRTLALPWFAGREAAMQFRAWADPYAEDDLELGPFAIRQPDIAAPEVVPDVVIMPLLAFSADGDRLGQGGGHYDRWLADHPQVRAIGLAWDTQLADDLPREAHDRRLDAIVTPTRYYEGDR